MAIFGLKSRVGIFSLDYGVQNRSRFFVSQKTKNGNYPAKTKNRIQAGLYSFNFGLKSRVAIFGLKSRVGIFGFATTLQKLQMLINATTLQKLQKFINATMLQKFINATTLQKIAKVYKCSRT